MYLTEDELTAFVQANPSVTYLDAIVIDLCGNAIGKRLPISQAASMIAGGTPICAAMQLVDVMGNTADPGGHGFSDGDPDGMARPLSGTLAPVPWSDGQRAQVLCQMTDATSATPVWYEPRRILATVVERFAELKLRPVLALELEFYLIDRDRNGDDSPRPCASPATGRRERQGQVLSLAKLDEFDSVIRAMQDAAHAQGLPVTTVISEYGAGQFEINLEHQTDPVSAADHAALLRRCVQATARAMGYDATFMSKPFAGQSGNGLHLHLSLLDEGGQNIFDPVHSDAEAKLGHAVAGLQATLHEAMAIFAPSLNVYRRFRPDEFTPVTRDWGENNRSVAVRLPPVTNGAARRLEHRVSGAEANPYLVTAAVLAGVHHGLTLGLDPGEKHTGNAGSEVDAGLPLTLWDALTALAEAQVLPDYLGAEYLQIYRDVKHAEFTEFMEEISGREYRWYL
ncbi:glutamine synthetase family protein [Roseovarius pelagicus]|uniref:Glutamine synthetase family protein n=1 Tax=Roseovarius pelagicus TaxID=2980108 RepID=A0ABY6DFL1_9RHOB|nr:glutamine synthetase family protein [Roseovarius pelagicus]UXX84967.1 glutamine synthetase family protein [Roseovarius pelagicus]